jgi:threonine/homoserine/homoserine lactone efflux protein
MAGREPGPEMFVVVTVKLAEKRHGAVILLVLLLLTQLPSGFLRVLQIAGGLFMMYLAWGIFVASRQQHSTTNNQPRPQSYLNAVLMNFISPWPYIYWSTITGPLFLQAWSKSTWAAFGFLGGFYSMLMGGFVVFVVLSATALRINHHIGKALPMVATAALLGFGGF